MRYNLQNTGAARLTWQVTSSSFWLTVLPSTGSLLPSGAMSVDVNISVNANANTFFPGTYTASVNFTNVGVESTTRNVTLTITNPSSSYGILVVTPSTGMAFSGSVGGPFSG
jgi:hypothetical protein